MPRGRRKSKVAEEANREEQEPMEVDEAGGDGQAPETEDAAPTILPDLTELKRDDDGGIHVGSNVYIPPPPPPALTFDSDKPRLIITHIENENFKSYAGKQTLGPFQKSFTSIVGPNGSGKSNVIDSMLFVFGYRAQKIRSKKISVLIHNSEGNQDIGSCTVRVFFQEIIDKKREEGDATDAADAADDDDFEVVPDSRFSVARTASRDNSSYYQIDNKRAQFKEVAKLLRDKGIDLDHNRFLILQGEVEQIALMKPKSVGEHDTGMLEFLEDIIGSSRFQEPIELLKNAHGALDDQRTEKLNRVKLVEKEKDELEGPRNAALDYLRLENQIMTKKNTIYQYYKFRSQKKIEELEVDKKAYEEKCKEVLEKVDKITEEKKSREEQVKEMNTALQKTRKQLDDAQEKFKKFDLEDTRMREELKSMNNRRKKVQHLAKQEKDKIEKLESVPEENKTKIEECHVLKEKLLAQVDEEQSNYDKAVETLNAETKEFQDQKAELETKMIPLKEDMNKKKSDLDIVQQELDLAKSKEEKEKTKLEQYRVQAEQEEAKLSSKKTRFETVSGDRPEMERELNELNGKIGGLREKEAKCLQKVRSMRSDFEEKRAKQTATRTMGQVHRAIMEQKNCGNLPGVFGRLGDLGAIDKKYDVAISTAIGGSLDCYLVDTPDTAKACIEFLRQHSLGRGNFFSLDKATNQWKSRMRASGSFPENAPRLFDLIRPQDDKFLPAFYHFCRDTLVAQDLQQSQRIAFGARRYRVVTLRGEICETTGAMEGGGRPLSGKMGTQVAQADEIDGAGLKQLEQDVHAAEETHRAAAKAKTDCEDRIRFLTSELQKSEREHQRLELELGASTEKVKALKAAIKQQEKVLSQTKTDEKVLAELRAKEEKLQAILDKSTEKVDDVKHQVKKLDATIKEIQSGKLKGITKRLEETKTQLDKVKKEITRLEVGIKSAERDLKKANDKFESYENEVKETENNMREKTKTRQEVEAQCKEVIDELKGLKEKEKEQNTESEELSQMLGKLRERENKYKSKQIEINSEREKFDNEIAEQSKGVSHWKRELKKLKLREIPGSAEPEVLPEIPDEELKEVDEKQSQYELTTMEERLGTMNVNYAIIEEYNRKEALYMGRVSELEDITSKRDSHRKAHDELRKMRLNEFMEGFVIITGKLKEMYQMITLGGDAELELVDSLDPFTEGIVFSVRPPKKSWKSISNLSGGEKTLSSLALIFALHYYKPTPLYVMDEIDAALDFKNVSIVANYIKERTKNAQFIIISLRSNMFELADRLVGIYKTYNATKSVTINPGKLAAMGKAKVQEEREKENAPAS